MCSSLMMLWTAMRRAEQPARTRPSEKLAILGSEGLQIVNNNF